LKIALAMGPMQHRAHPQILSVLPQLLGRRPSQISFGIKTQIDRRYRRGKGVPRLAWREGGVVKAVLAGIEPVLWSGLHQNIGHRAGCDKERATKNGAAAWGAMMRKALWFRADEMWPPDVKPCNGRRDACKGVKFDTVVRPTSRLARGRQGNGNRDNAPRP